jgi:hypothetical protein
MDVAVTAPFEQLAYQTGNQYVLEVSARPRTSRSILMRHRCTRATALRSISRIFRHVPYFSLLPTCRT